MNFFKKRKAAKELAQKIGSPPESNQLNGTDHGHNEVLDDNCDLVSSPRFDLSTPSEPIPDFPPRSRLAKTLSDTLKEDAACGHFIQFMESQAAGHLVRFWLDAESFRITTITRFRSELNNAQPQGECAKPSVTAASTTVDANAAFSQENRVNASTEAALALSKASRLPEANGECVQNQTSHNEKETVVSLPPHKMPSERPRNDAVPASTTPSPSALTARTLSTPHQQIGKDAVFIYRKYICPNVTRRIELTEEAYHSIVSRICCEDGGVDPECFVDAQNAVFEEMRRRFPAYRESEFHLKYQIDLLTSAKLTLSDILYHENALVHFMEYVEIEGGLPLIQFWLLVENFTKLLPSSREQRDEKGSGKKERKNDNDDHQGPTEEDQAAQMDAMVIYDKYFSLQATEALGFGDDVRFQVESNICTEDGRVDAKCFETPVKLVLNLVAKEYLQPFLRSSICYRWLSDLINSRRLGGITTNHPRRGSDASSSEASVGSSLQATGSAKKTPSKKREKKTVQDMLGESRISVDDPDSIWRRKHNAGPLTFGKIDPMGDYRSELAFHPDTLKKKGSGRITRALKNLVQDESEVRAREDMAAQIAQMVINDVTSLTMGKPAFDLEPDDDDDGDASENDNDVS